jgi:hypothetical protein
MEKSSMLEPRPTSRRVRADNIRQNLIRISEKYHLTPIEDLDTLEKLADDAANQVQNLEKRLEGRRAARSIPAKSGHALQQFASTIHDFLKVYSGVVEVSKGVDAQYGGIVCGALSLLVSVSTRMALEARPNVR